MMRTGTPVLVLLVGLSGILPAAVEGMLEAGVSRSRVEDGPSLIAWTAQPTLILRSSAFVAPLIGVCLGPVGFLDRDTHDRAIGIEGRLVAGLSVGGPHDPRGEVRAGWGVGWWDGRGLGGDADGWRSWGRTFGGEAILTWPVGERVRIGPLGGWLRREPDQGLTIDEWRIGVALGYDFGG
jgi:hypothetical protein